MIALALATTLLLETPGLFVPNGPGNDLGTAGIAYAPPKPLTLDEANAAASGWVEKPKAKLFARLDGRALAADKAAVTLWNVENVDRNGVVALARVQGGAVPSVTVRLSGLKKGKRYLVSLRTCEASWAYLHFGSATASGDYVTHAARGNLPIAFVPKASEDAFTISLNPALQKGQVGRLALGGIDVYSLE